MGVMNGKMVYGIWMGQLKTGGPEKQNYSTQEKLGVSESPF
jgi:hypothetical protein